MKWEDANKNNDGLVARINLTEKETRKRLTSIYSKEKIDEIIISAQGFKAVTDEYIVVMYDKFDNTFSIIASPKKYMDLVKP